MSERGSFRGARGGTRGGEASHRGSGHPPRGGRGGGAGPGSGAPPRHNNTSSSERPKKENILDLGKYMDKEVTVKFSGGREGMAVEFPWFSCFGKSGGATTRRVLLQQRGREGCWTVLTFDLVGGSCWDVEGV